jgi:predicted nucleic acid-binding protein
MENSELVLCDTDIIIEFYKGNELISSKLEVIGVSNIAISSVTAAELIFGAFNKKELIQICKDIESLNILRINYSINDVFLELMKKYSLSHKLRIPDCLIAASSIVQNLPLYILNKKDFVFIENLILFDD